MTDKRNKYRCLNCFRDYRTSIEAKKCCSNSKSVNEFTCKYLICKYNNDGTCKNKYEKCKGVHISIKKDSSIVNEDDE